MAIQDGLAGESLIGIEPALQQQVSAGWRRRLALFTGRTLTASALDSEQAYLRGRLAILGQCVTQGIVKGLELSIDFTAADPVVQVTPGYGISASGEDVSLARALRTTLGSLQVIDPQTGAALAAFPDYTTNSANKNYAVVLLLQPVTCEASGASLDTGPIRVSGNLTAVCNQDPDANAFADWQIADGVRLVMVAWPSAPAALALPSPLPAVSYRNRLAYTVFNAEMALTPDDRLPWDMLGVPLAVVGFNAAWQPQFVDLATVARTGGLTRGRYVVPMQSGPQLLVQPALAQARVRQFAEQTATTPGLNSLAAAFPLLPPCGLLPTSSMDFVNREALWLPANWTIEVGPVHEEEVETALLTAMTAQPLDMTQSESVEVLVPLPDSVYDPDVLVTAVVAPDFQQAVDDATSQLAVDLQKRKAIEQEANALSQVLTGSMLAGVSRPPRYDLDAGLTQTEIALRDTQAYTPPSTESFGTTLPQGTTPAAYQSNDYQSLLDAANGPYTLTRDGNGNLLAQPLPLFSSDDLTDLANNGLQHFINLITGKINKANDLLDLAFLTSQSDIYRFRQYVLGATGATALAVSPIAAEIATGESAASTSANLQTYLGNILAAKATTAAPVTTTTPPALQIRAINVDEQAAATQSNSTAFNLRPAALSTGGVIKSPTTIAQVAPRADISELKLASGLTTRAPASDLRIANEAALKTPITSFNPTTLGTTDDPASTSDVTEQSPLVGAQLNLRTLTIAQRLANPPSQEGLFYAVGNRLALLQLLADLEIVIDDIPILIDIPSSSTGTTPTATQPPGSIYTLLPTVADIRKNAARQAAVFAAVQSPQISVPSDSDPDEASLFSAGIHVLEQHSSLLRAVEGRIRQYNDFLALCSTKLSSVQSSLSQAQTLLTALDNDVAQKRQDVAFTSALLSDEVQRVSDLNKQRAYTLQNYVQFVAFLRPRTVVTTADVFSRQLVPGNVTNPVPSCLSQSTAIPPELREITTLLREAPVTWLPSVEALLKKLERPSLLQSVAVDAQARATLQLQLPQPTSSAAGKPGVYAPAIASIYSANQQAFRQIQTQRAAFQPQVLAGVSWTSQVETLKYMIAPADLISSSAVHAEVVHATARVIQQVSSVATCLYTRANQAVPEVRLMWAEFLRGQGVNVQLQSLAVLPNWNAQDYVSQQQMQMLVDWLFLQIDAGNTSAAAFMSDVVRASILLASAAPVNSVIAGAVTLTATPKVGGVVSLTLPSDRVAHGMYVQLYNAGVLTAQAVVSDLDNTSVRATVTQVYKPGTSLQVNDVAHFVTQEPFAAAIRAFDR